uniref:Uncharacterized protein n=1 Tax=uncultured bacterium UPO53 TaxID=1776978 RepID=A0A126SYF6_9BACT|nr:hypothetical protein PA14_54480 [uncultured bacterium UPO53]
MTTPWTSLLASTTLSSPVPATAVIPLPSLAVLMLTGPESMKFLQGQTTTDFREVEKGLVRRGAVCSLKGRVLFSFIAVPLDENVALVLPTDQLEAALSHLKKYAVFAKTQLSDASATVALASIAGPDAKVRVTDLFGQVPATEQVVRTAAGWAIRIGQEPRFLLGLSPEMLGARWPVLSASAAAESLWWSAEIRAGLATVFAATRDRFQPQELNFHAIDAVSYNKGCYTGQEVVARLYFRGKLKQRLYVLEGKARELPENAGVFAGDDHVGDIVMSARDGDTLRLLAVVKNTAARDSELTLGEHGDVLTVGSLPYALPTDKEE